MADETKVKKAKVAEEEVIEETVEETVTNEVEEEKVAEEAAITSINLGFVEKQKFRINGDYNRILEICTSDLNVIARYNEMIPKLDSFMDDVQKEFSKLDDADKDLIQTSELLTKIDKEIRKCIDYIFDANASEVCAPTGNMFDPIGGQFRYEHIIECLVKLYAEGVGAEFEKIKNRTAKYTSKYKKRQ